MLGKSVHDLILKIVPLNLCDACVAHDVGSTAAKVKAVTDQFGLTSDFKRYPGLCSHCGKDRLVTRGG